ncbi:hypothetical protein AALO_G00288260 [Alosa alosa]|uniref:Uncharacterized protein n=1 Tax=Alosa alosa TaxID=278164 RepID=A0AAV6FG56_9TELE|nr:hypothetical protein AALO_G00288260 [Alosa alosa]
MQVFRHLSNISNTHLANCNPRAGSSDRKALPLLASVAGSSRRAETPVPLILTLASRTRENCLLPIPTPIPAAAQGPAACLVDGDKDSTGHHSQPSPRV